MGPQECLQQKPLLREPAKHQMGSIYYRHFEESAALALILGQKLMHSEAVHGTGFSAQSASTPKLLLATSPQD